MPGKSGAGDKSTQASGVTPAGALKVDTALSPDEIINPSQPTTRNFPKGKLILWRDPQGNIVREATAHSNGEIGDALFAGNEWLKQNYPDTWRDFRMDVREGDGSLAPAQMATPDNVRAAAERFDPSKDKFEEQSPEVQKAIRDLEAARQPFETARDLDKVGIGANTIRATQLAEGEGNTSELSTPPSPRGALPFLPGKSEWQTLYDEAVSLLPDKADNLRRMSPSQLRAAIERVRTVGGTTVTVSPDGSFRSEPAPSKPSAIPAIRAAGTPQKPRYLSDAPFTKDDIERFNRFTHFPKDVERENARWKQDTEQIESETRTQLAKYGVTDTPENVRRALDKLSEARYDIFMRTVRAREIAPPWSVVGPARYMEHANPTKAENMIQKGFDNYAEAKARLERAIRQNGPSRIISADEADAVEQLQAKIEKAQRLQQVMKDANVIIRKKGMTDEQRVEKLTDMGLSSTNAWKLLKPDFANRIGFPAYELTNNSANVRRMQDRVTAIERNRATPGDEYTFDGGKVVDNADENRVQIVFESKPPAETIAKLKANGFKWAPSQGAWQRQRTESAKYAAKQITGAPADETPRTDAKTTSRGLPPFLRRK